VIEAPDITGGELNVLIAEMVWAVFNKFTFVEREPSGIVLAVMEAPLITGAVEKVFAPEKVCIPVNRATFVVKDPSGIVPEILEPLIVGGFVNVFVPVNVLLELAVITVPFIALTGIVPGVIEAPDMTGAVEKVFVPEKVCVPDNSATFEDNEPFGPVGPVGPFPRTGRAGWSCDSRRSCS